MPQCYGVENRKARKPHKCRESKGVILIGEIYHFHHGVWDGQGQSFKHCADCELIFNRMVADADYPEEGPAFGSLYEGIFDGDILSEITEFLDIRRKRGAKIEEWMIQRESEHKDLLANPTT